MVKQRDYQRQRVYGFEDRVIRPAILQRMKLSMSLPECERVVWMLSGVFSVDTPRVTVQPKRVVESCYMHDSQRIILAPGMRNLYYVAHEFAHHLVFVRGGVKGHGPEFVRAWINIASLFTTDNGAGLLEAALMDGLDVAENHDRWMPQDMDKLQEFRDNSSVYFDPIPATDRVYETILKLVRLQESSNEAEVATAANHVSKLLAKYNLNLDTVMGYAGQIDDEPITHMWAPLGAGPGQPVSWCVSILFAICDLNFCTPLWYNRERKIVVIGRRTNVLVAMELYHYLISQVERMKDKFAEMLVERLKQDGNRITGGQSKQLNNSFRLGCSDRLVYRLRKEQKEPKEDDAAMTALVSLRNQENLAYRDNNFKVTNRAAVVRQRKNQNAYAIGAKLGAKIPLSKPKELGTRAALS